MNARGGWNGQPAPPSGIDEYVFPMSFAQQRLWFLDAVAPGNPFYNIPLRIPLRGRIDRGAVERALNAIIGRHEALRTTFDVIDGEPSQVVRSSRTIELAHRRVDHLLAGDVADAVESLATAEARTPFDLRTGPLIRATLVTRSAHDHELLLTIHHIVADGWSVGILCRELSELYVAEVSGRPARLPELAVQYADFTMWQREQLRGDRLDELLHYWRTQLDSLPVLEMPTDRPRPRVLDYTGAYIPVELSADLAAQVRAFAQRERATPFMALMAAFASLLGRYTAQDDIVVGTPIANRNIADTEQIIGFFVNSLVVRCDLRDEPTFREVLQRVRRTCLDAYAHQDLPFERLVEDLKPERDLARNPLFQATFQLVNTPSAGAGGQGAPPTVQRGSAIFDLAFTIVDSPGPLRGMIEFSTQLFDNATIARLAAHYRLLLSAVVADPDVRLADIGFLTRPERDLLVAQRIPSPPRIDALTDAVSASVRSAPESIAVVADDGRLDFRQLDARAGAVAHRLRELGVRSGDLVALLADGSSWLPAAMLGVHRLGAAYLPLDPLQPRERLDFMLADAGPTAIIAGATDMLPTAGPPVVRLDELDELDGSVDAPIAPTGSGADPAYVLYTSGSSGVPKGVVIPRSALENHMAWMLSEFEFGPHDRVLQRTTPIFDASVWEFWAPMMAGAQLVLLGAAAKRDPAEIAAAVRHHRITVLQVVPGLLHTLLDEPDFLAADTLRVVFSGGEALPDELRDHFGAMFDVPLVNLYGPTEATIDATFHRCRPASGRSVPIGRPIAGTGAVVLDRSGRPTPIGVPGRLHLSGEGLALGYLGQPRLTAERFVPDEFGDVPGARLYDTGDLVRFRTDGDLEYLGRSDLQVKVRGFRIELAEIERAVEACSGVRRTAAVVHADQIVAYVAPEPAAGSASDDVDEAEQEALDRWEDIYEQIYGQLSGTPTGDEADRLDRDDVDPDDLDAIGWVSSFTGRYIDRAAMAAWRDQTVERILALQPRPRARDRVRHRHDPEPRRTRDRPLRRDRLLSARAPVRRGARRARLDALGRAAPTARPRPRRPPRRGLRRRGPQLGRAVLPVGALPRTGPRRRDPVPAPGRCAVRRRRAFAPPAPSVPRRGRDGEIRGFRTGRRAAAADRRCREQGGGARPVSGILHRHRRALRTGAVRGAPQAQRACHRDERLPLRCGDPPRPPEPASRRR